MVFSIIIDGFQNLIGTVGQGNGPIALLGFRWTGSPIFLFVPKFQGLIDSQCALFPIDCIPGQADQFTGTKTGL